MGTEGDSSNIFAVLESKGEGLVAMQKTGELISGVAPALEPRQTLPNQRQRPYCPQD
jgi:hypothetical protein